MSFTPLSCSFLGVLLLTSAWAKLAAPDSFRTIASEYPLPARVPPRLIARAVPVIEMILAASLLGWPLWNVRPACWGAALFLLVISAAVAIRRARGERRFACGCAGDLSRPHSASWILARNAVLVLLAAAPIWFGDGAVRGWRSALPAYLTGCGAALAWYLTEAMGVASQMKDAWKATG